MDGLGCLARPYGSRRHSSTPAVSLGVLVFHALWIADLPVSQDRVPTATQVRVRGGCGGRAAARGLCSPRAGSTSSWRSASPCCWSSSVDRRCGLGNLRRGLWVLAFTTMPPALVAAGGSCGVAMLVVGPSGNPMLGGGGVPRRRYRHAGGLGLAGAVVWAVEAAIKRGNAAKTWHTRADRNLPSR